MLVFESLIISFGIFLSYKVTIMNKISNHKWGFLTQKCGVGPVQFLVLDRKFFFFGHPSFNGEFQCQCVSFKIAQKGKRLDFQTLTVSDTGFPIWSREYHRFRNPQGLWVGGYSGVRVWVANLYPNVIFWKVSEIPACSRCSPQVTWFDGVCFLVSATSF